MKRASQKDKDQKPKRTRFNQEIVKSEEAELSEAIDVAYREIAVILQEARAKAYYAVNETMVRANWETGRVIVEREQQGLKRAGYGTRLIQGISLRLTAQFGKGFDERNLWYMKQFYLTFPIVNALRSELSWTHYRLLLRVESEDARSFYVNEAINSRWGTRELERQVNSLFYERLALSRDQQGVRRLAGEGQVIETAEDLIKDPYVLEFLNVKADHRLLEKDLEQALIDRLQAFLLELGRGFAFVARQKRITVDGDHFYVDLVFYNYALKCFALIDLKLGKLTHQDIGQMDFYVRWFEREEKAPDDGPTIGLILCSDKNQSMVKYTLLETSQQIFASKYKLYLPTEEELRRELQREREQIEREQRLRQSLPLKRGKGKRKA